MQLVYCSYEVIISKIEFPEMGRYPIGPIQLVILCMNRVRVLQTICNHRLTLSFSLLLIHILSPSFSSSFSFGNTYTHTDTYTTAPKWKSCNDKNTAQSKINYIGHEKRERNLIVQIVRIKEDARYQFIRSENKKTEKMRQHQTRTLHLEQIFRCMHIVLLCM